jgi:ABC-2 type transport system ATP-binding protein
MLEPGVPPDVAERRLLVADGDETEERQRMTTAITVSGLVKSFGATRALDGLDLSIEVGEVHGFLGPNSAGKSTTIRVLLGLLRADSGEASVLGGDPWRDAVELHRRLAYVPGDVELWPSLTGGEAIDLLGRLRGGLNERRRAELIERFDLDPTKKGAPTPKATARRWHSWPRWPPTPNCCCSTSPPPGWTR